MWRTCEKLSLNNLNAAQDKLQYNARGGIYAWNVYNAEEERSAGNGPMVARGIMERDLLGHTTREYYEDADGKIMTNAYGWTNTYATVDKFGNMVARFNHDASGKRINNPLLGYSGYVMDFDESGKYRTSLTYQDADGSPVIPDISAHLQILFYGKLFPYLPSLRDIGNSPADDVLCLPLVLSAVLAAHRLGGRGPAWRLPLTHGILALGLFIATNWLVIKGGERVGPHLQLLSQYFIGYRVTFLGSFIDFFNCTGGGGTN